MSFSNVRIDIHLSSEIGVGARKVESLAERSDFMDSRRGIAYSSEACITAFIVSIKSCSLSFKICDTIAPSHS